MALVDAGYKFTFVDIGNYGSQSDGAVFKHSSFGQKFINGELHIPGPKALPNYPQGGVLPHCIVGDEAFPCHGSNETISKGERSEHVSLGRTYL